METSVRVFLVLGAWAVCVRWVGPYVWGRPNLLPIYMYT
jgi:hypothetical protein